MDLKKTRLKEYRKVNKYGCLMGVEVPLVSMVVLAYNHEKYIEKCVTSLLSQRTNFNFEIILGEDDSQDCTREICIKLADDCKEIIKLYLHNNENKLRFEDKPTGKYNLLYSYRECRGKYIAICEGDDYWTDQDKLQRQVDFLEAHPEYAIHCGHARMLADDPEKNGRRIHEEICADRTYELTDFVENSRVVTCTAMFRNIGYDEFPEGFLKIPAGDWYNWIYVMQQTGGKVFYENRDLAAYRVHSGGVYSSLSSLGYLLFYEQNLKGISALFTDPALKRKALNKRNWYLEQIFRHYVGHRQHLKALQLLPDLLLNGYTLKSAFRLLMEWKNTYNYKE